MKLELGSTVDRYTVEAVIGAGGTAMVYRVKHNALGTYHALKVLTVTSEAIRKRMLNEGRVQASLRHLNLVAVTDVLDISGAPGLLMEYIEGPSLELALGSYRIRMGDAETLFLGIVAGVRHAHQIGVVHRDLKPANVLLSRAQEGFLPKVTDFGLVKTLSGDPSVAHTRAGIAMGTPSYMAPEQIRDARTVDQRADVWSLGCILYELVTRGRAFPGEQALEIYNAVILGEYPDPRRVVPDLPDRIDAAIRGALCVDRDKRIPDCDTLLEVVKGQRQWVTPERGESTHETDEAPRVLPADVPDMPVARRGPGGSTPGPAPVRGRLPPAPSALVPPANEATVGLDSVASVHGTLSPRDSLNSGTDERRLWVLVVLAAALPAAVVVGAAVFVVGAWFWYSQPDILVSLPQDLSETPAPQPQPTPAPIVEPDSPEEVAPVPTSAPVEAAPRPRPSPRPALVRSQPEPVAEPAPAPAPVAPSVYTVKLLSIPPTATLMVDGVSQGRTPKKLTLRSGRHVISVTSAGVTAEYVVEVSSSGANKWCYDFATGENKAGGC